MLGRIGGVHPWLLEDRDSTSGWWHLTFRRSRVAQIVKFDHLSVGVNLFN